VDQQNALPSVGNDVPRSASLEASVNFLCENYYSCTTEHEKKCFPDGPSYLPKRTVDVSNNDRYSLVEHSTGTVGVYAALSYSWGDRGFAMATSANFEELKHGFERAILPMAFQDAAVMARSLDIDYLWIDTLCIIQDSRSDWEEQAARMGGIFEAAAITISASSSLNPYHTLFGQRDRMYEEIDLFSGKKGAPSDVKFKARRKIDRGIHTKTGRSTYKDPLDTRAWGLQEKLLSRRLIAFTGAELQWTCRTSRACECQQKTYPAQPLFTDDISKSSAERIRENSKIWSKTVEEYSSRELRFPLDRLPALSGLARKFGARTGLTYNAGGWNETLLYDLVWQRDVESSRITESWISPSYSWASAPGAVSFRYARHSYPGSRILHAEVVVPYYETVGKDIYGKAKDGALTIRGHMVAAQLRRSSSGDAQGYTIYIGDAEYTPNTSQRSVCEFSIDAAIPSYSARTDSMTTHGVLCGSSSEDTSLMIEGPVTLLSLYSIHDRRYLYQNFLVLARSQEGADTYKRVGIGSGKLYRGDSIPQEAHLVRPFEWLSVDVAKHGRSIVEVEEQVVCIR
jgi:hypothetical protein